MFSKPSHTELGDGWSPAIAAGVILAIALAVMLIPGPHDSIADRLPLVLLVVGSCLAGVATTWLVKRYRSR